MKTHISEVEVLYWMLEDNLYKGKTDDAVWVFDMMVYMAKYRKELLVQGLKRRQRERLKEIAYELNGEGYKKITSIVMKQPLSPKKLPFAKEKGLKYHLADNLDILQKALQEEIKLVGIEVETDFEYACDIVVASTKNFYPVELKVDKADHRVVSQILKYCYYFYRKLRYDRFKEIQGVVCANGMDAWSINELRREGMWVYDIMPDGKDNIKLRRITD